MSNILPFVSVIMPIRNEAAFIERSLGAVLAQDYPPDCLEVLIADGMSTDETRAIIERLADQHPQVSVRVIDNPGKIVPTGFNAALAKAHGDVIVRVDGHTVIAPDYVRECVVALQQSGADNVGGKMTAVGMTALGQAVALATSSPFGVGGARFHYSDREEWVDTVYMGAWPRRVFEQLGGFDPELVRNQDDEFNYRLRAQGGRILLSPRIRSQYYNRTSLRSLWRQYYQYGFYKVRVLQKPPRQMRPRQFVPPAFVATILGGALLSPFSRIVRRLWGLAVSAYAVVNLFASWRIARKAGREHLWRLPVVFSILHFSYGLGFLHGLIHFRDRWGR
ncbi:MAG: glycosyltransferase family 2 protein [Chloroflexota bacterium]|jgi:glycosyltransferase involved in cell wall biosynthesis